LSSEGGGRKRHRAGVFGIAGNGSRSLTKMNTLMHEFYLYANIFYCFYRINCGGFMRKAILSIFLLIISANNMCFANKFNDLKSSYKTQLTKLGESPQAYTNDTPSSGVEAIQYDSNGLKLKAWFARPDKKTSETVPAVIYLHGGFSFGKQDFDDTKEFLDNGFAVMTPIFRGENGNMGSFELFYGEVDDALAAVDWLQKQDGIDKDRIFIFGHSTGGAISELTSLSDKKGVLLSGSSGALYPPQVFTSWGDIIPFDLNNKREVFLRTFMLNTKYMERKHIAYLGKDDIDNQLVSTYQKIISEDKAPLEIKMMDGDHFSSLHDSIKQFIVEANKF
jgi:hypothetical protein